jgi:hypothetical protein
VCPQTIFNQKKLLDDYYRQRLDEFESAETYVDDGCTGTDTNRADFQRLLADIYAKKVNCVIVKDLSCLSRNYTDAGSLIENLFVQMNVRFISLAEGVDSYLNLDSVSSHVSKRYDRQGYCESSERPRCYVSFRLQAKSGIKVQMPQRTDTAYVEYHYYQQYAEKSRLCWRYGVGAKLCEKLQDTQNRSCQNRTKRKDT